MFESGRQGRLPGLGVVRRFQLCRWHMVIRLQEPPVIEPVDPLEGGELHSLEVAPGTALADQLGLVQPDDRLGERIVVLAALPRSNLPLSVRA